MSLWDIEHEYPTTDMEDAAVLCDRCPFRIRTRTSEPPQSDRPLLEQLHDLRIDFSTIEEIPDPIARQEQVMLILGYNKAIEDATKLMVRGLKQVIESEDGVCLDNEADRQQLLKSFYGEGNTGY